jgi:hypothetical protein
MSQDRDTSILHRSTADAHFTLVPGGPRVMLSEHARETGRQELPLTSATEPNDFETAIIRQHQQEHTTLLERARSGLQGLMADADRAAKQLPRRGDAELEVKRVADGVERGLQAQRGVALLDVERRRRLRDLRVFARRNRLGREAHYPESAHLTMALLVVFIVIESAFNMAFFGQASDYGMLGGFFIALSVSAINVISAYFVGRGARYLNHVDTWRRSLTAGGLVVFVSLMLVYHLAIGHYRDLLSNAPASVHDSLGVLARGPQDLGMNSALLVCAGLLAAILAGIKGYLSDDPYPGYGQLDRRLRDAGQAYEDARTRELRELLAPVQALPTACDARVATGARALESLRAVHVAASQLAHEYDAGRTRLQDHSRVFLSEYREENSMIRTTKPPAYFEEFPAFEDELDRSSLTAMADRIRFAEQALLDFQGEVDEVKRANHVLLSDTARRHEDRIDGLAGRIEEDARRADGDAMAELQGERRAS